MLPRKYQYESVEMGGIESNQSTNQSTYQLID